MGGENKVKEGVRIMRCTCTHEFQDQVYGKGMRVHNVSKTGYAACTVCTPRLCTNRLDPAAETPPHPAFGHGRMAARADRNKGIKKVSD